MSRFLNLVNGAPDVQNVEEVIEQPVVDVVDQPIVEIKEEAPRRTKKRTKK